MKFINQISILILAIAFIISCKKQDANADIPQSDKTQFDYKSVKVPDNFFKELAVPGVADNNDAPTANLTESGNPDPNNGDDPIVLGQQVPNPYTIANMQQAYLQLYGSTAPVPVTHLYVRYKPANTDQLATLLDQSDLELQDYPMDYKVLQDGDYYQDPTLGTEDIGWLYTAVPANYTPVAGIQYEVIQQLHIPPIDDLLLESMAESITGGAIYDDTVILADRYITRVDEPSDTLIVPNRLPVPCELEPCGPNCPPQDPNNPYPCGGGGTPPPTLPSGIYVEEQTVCNQPTRILPVRQINVVAKRWFKFWRGYTDDNGKFTVTKNFKNKVKIIVKTKNDNARVSKVRGIRLWQMLFPCRKRIGVFNGSELPRIRYVFTQPTDGSASNKDLAYWASATTHNSIIEFREYTTEFNLPQPPSNLKVMVTNWGFMENAGAAPMWNKCNNNVIPASFATFFVANSNFVLAGVTVLTTILKNQMDMIIGYKSTDYNCVLTSSQLRSVVYHELGHAQHYSQAGCDFWTQYRNAIVTELSKLNQVDFHPYGTGNDQSTAPILATGEMWGNHVEKWYSERHYGNGGAVAVNFFSRLQGLAFSNDATSGLNANYWSIENFNPNRNQDVHRWIPQGLPYDLWDNRNEFPTPFIDDNATGFTINQSFNALQSDVHSISAFRDRLLQQNGNNQQVQVNTLINAYNY